LKGYVTFGIDITNAGLQSISEFFAANKNKKCDVLETTTYFASYNHVL